MTRSNNEMLQALARSHGITLFGACSIENEQERFHSEIKTAARNLNYAVCMGLPLSPEVFETILDGPNDLYKTHYRQANAILDLAAFQISRQIGISGYRAIPIAASCTVDEKMQAGHLSHKWLAEKAGLGWRGRNNLLVTRRYGSAVRLATVLTDIPLELGTPVEFGCGDCRQCLSECPAQALGQLPGDYDFERCYGQLLKYSKRNNFGYLICGHCIKVCKPK